MRAGKAWMRRRRRRKRWWWGEEAGLVQVDGPCLEAEGGRDGWGLVHMGDHQSTINQHHVRLNTWTSTLRVSEGKMLLPCRHPTARFIMPFFNIIFKT